MPIYEYKCKKCGMKFEILQRLNDDGSNLRCPRCQADKPEKLLSIFGSTGNGSYGGSCSPGSFT